MYPPDHALILLSVVPHLRDLEIVRLLGWYRIPLRRAPKIIAVDYLAFYQTAAFGEKRWRVEWIAPVAGHELVTRAELLRDEPQHPRAQEEYYKIMLGDLIQLPNPILAGNWKRITFLYTTGEYLRLARTVNDLVVHSEERKFLWRALCERGAAGGYRTAPTQLPVDLEPAVLAVLLGFKEG